MARNRGLPISTLFEVANIYMNIDKYTAGNPFDDAVVTFETFKQMYLHKYLTDVYDAKKPSI